MRASSSLSPHSRPPLASIPSPSCANTNTNGRRRHPHSQPSPVRVQLRTALPSLEAPAPLVQLPAARVRVCTRAHPSHPGESLHFAFVRERRAITSPLAKTNVIASLVHRLALVTSPPSLHPRNGTAQRRVPLRHPHWDTRLTMLHPRAWARVQMRTRTHSERFAFACEHSSPTRPAGFVPVPVTGTRSNS